MFRRQRPHGGADGGPPEDQVARAAVVRHSAQPDQRSVDPHHAWTRLRRPLLAADDCHLGELVEIARPELVGRGIGPHRPVPGAAETHFGKNRDLHATSELGTRWRVPAGRLLRAPVITPGVRTMLR